MFRYETVNVLQLLYSLRYSKPYSNSTLDTGAHIVAHFIQVSRRSRRTDTSHLNGCALYLWRRSTQRTGPQITGQAELGLNKVREDHSYVLRGASVISYERYRSLNSLEKPPLYYYLCYRHDNSSQRCLKNPVRTRVPRPTDAAGLDPLRVMGYYNSISCRMNGADGGVSSSLDAPITYRRWPLRKLEISRGGHAWP